NQTALAQADASDAFFDDSYVHEIYLTFDNADYGTDGWYATLYESHANDADDPYFPASFSADGVTIATVGVRFKGNSSFNANSIKKSFKIDFDEYDEDNDELVFYDLKKLNLNNGFKDPTMLREKLFLDFAGDFVSAPRAVHTKVYVNGEYYGLYTAVEQVDKTFVQNRFGDDEDGNLFKGAASDAADANDDFGSDLTWLGSDETTYYNNYVLKTNETANDYSQLVTFIDTLNNSSAADFPTNLEPLFDVENGLQGLALNNLFVNLDSYNGSAHNYYLYDRDDTGQFTHIPWDTNESFGRFTMFVSSGDNPLELDPFWLPTATRPGDDEERPLMENLWANDDYNNNYLCYLDQMLDAGFDETTMEARIGELANLIRTDLYADPNKLYSNAQFESNLTTNIQDGRDTIYGLSYFVQQRADYLQSELTNYTLDCASLAITDLSGTLFINEFMADNDTTLQDPDGTGYPDWFEIYNAGATEIDLQGMYLTDDLTDPTQHAITQSLTIPANGYLILYADNDPEQGANHIGFKLGSSGEDLAIFNTDGSTLIDSYTFGEQTADTSEGRCPDGGDTWTFFTSSTPGASNEPCGTAPIISTVSHSPTVPAASDDVTVTAVITDDVTLNSATLWYSIGGSYTAVTMTDQGSDSYTATIPAQADNTTVTYYLEAADNESFTTTEPANAPTSAYSYIIGYEAPTLYINELMADNDTTLADPDEADSYPDWIELYNPGSEAIDLGGLYLTDDLTDPTQFQIPTGLTILGGGFLLFYADNDTEQGDQHTNFKLSANGESVALLGADGLTQIDSVTFTTQTTDMAYGRQTDGTGDWGTMCEATPGSANTGICTSGNYVIYLPIVVNP
ncbi:MAG: hypothetical protein DWQ04_32535, partial [Chloroflexi bacterium]